MQLTELINNYLSSGIRERMKHIDTETLEKTEEIRIRAGLPMHLKCGKDKVYIYDVDSSKPYTPTSEDISATLSKMSDYSVYAFNDEIKRGYITLPGGYRVGICGSVVSCSDGVGINTLKNISSINIRVRREIKGCADMVLHKVCRDGKFLSTLIISPPACGKTTLLRDMIRQLSNSGYCVGVVDERSEIAGTYRGQAQNDVGLHTDIIDACRKSVGMYMLLRSMAPDIIAVDEIGSEDELKSIIDIVNSGVSLLCTVHSNDITELMKKPFFNRLTEERAFCRYIILGNVPSVGSVQAVLDEELIEI
jgi:stage III sporulation protein AA